MPCGKHDRAADDLVGLRLIDAQPDRDLDRLVELRAVVTLEHVDRFGNRHRIFFPLLGQCFEIVWIALAMTVTDLFRIVRRRVASC